jgi:hypothetical protein
VTYMQRVNEQGGVFKSSPLSMSGQRAGYHLLVCLFPAVLRHASSSWNAAAPLCSLSLFSSQQPGAVQVLRYVRELPYIPLDRTRVQAAEDDFRRRASTTSALTKSVPALVVAAAGALAVALQEVSPHGSFLCWRVLEGCSTHATATNDQRQNTHTAGSRGRAGQYVVGK